MAVEVKQRALEAQLFQRSYDQLQYLTFNHTPRDQNQESCVYRDTPFPQRPQGRRLQEGGVFGQQGSHASDVGFDLFRRMIEKGWRLYD